MDWPTIATIVGGISATLLAVGKLIAVTFEKISTDQVDRLLANATLIADALKSRNKETDRRLRKVVRALKRLRKKKCDWANRPAAPRRRKPSP